MVGSALTRTEIAIGIFLQRLYAMYCTLQYKVALGADTHRNTMVSENREILPSKRPLMQCRLNFISTDSFQPS